MRRETCPHCGQLSPDPLGVSLDSESNSIFVDGIPLKLSPQLSKLFIGLWSRRPRYVSYDILFEDLYGLDDDEEWPSSRVLSVYLTNLRHALEGTSFIIDNIHGRGWRLTTKAELLREPQWIT